MRLVQLKIQELSNIGLSVHKHEIHTDSRGALSVHFEAPTTKTNVSFKKSFSNPGVGRGLHVQSAPYQQEKYISVTRGSIIDFVYDTTSSEQLLYCFKLDDDSSSTVHVPHYFAHGFITLEPSDFEYVVLGEYSQKHESTLNVLPSAADLLGLGAVELSEKDAAFPKIRVTI